MNESTPTATAPAIRLENVTKTYGAVVAVDGVSFEVRSGEVVGFLGANGAGKTTVLKLLSSWLEPTQGKVEVLGLDVTRSALAVRARIGYLPEHNSLYEIMRVSAFLRFVGEMRGLEGARLAERTTWVVEKCDLGAILGKRIQECSKGNRQRLGLAAALIHDPPVVLLDEPTHGLDPIQVASFLDLVRQLGRERAVLFSSHVLAETLAVSDRLLVIDHGRLVANLASAALKERAKNESKEPDQVLLDLVRAGKAKP